MNTGEHLELFLTLNTEAFKKALGDTGAAVSAMSGKSGTALGGMRDRLRENLTVARDYNAELGRQGGLLQSLAGKVTALVGAYLGLQTIAGVTRILRDAETAGFGLEASLRAANREFGNIGSMEQWSETLEQLSGRLRIYSKGELAAAAARTVDMTKRLGMSATQMEQVIALSGDLAAGKTDLEGAIERVTAALRGEAESAEYLGLTLGETYVKAWYEAHNATGMAWKDLDDLQKAQVRYNVFLEQALPLQGKAAESISTMAGAWALARATIHDAVIENENAIAAAKQLAQVIAEHADQIGELATVIISAAAKTMEFVLAHKEAVGVVGALALGIGVVSAAISSLTTIWGALNTVMLITTGSKIVPFLGSVVTALKGAELASLSLKTVLGSLSALLLAFEIGRQIGTWINQFGIVKKAGVGLAYALDRTGLAAQKMWAMLTGGDVKAVERKIEIAKDAYKKSIDEIDRAADEAEKKKSAATEKTQQKPATEPAAAAEDEGDKKKQPASPYLSDDELKKTQAAADDAWRKNHGLPSQAEEKADAEQKKQQPEVPKPKTTPPATDTRTEADLAEQYKKSQQTEMAAADAQKKADYEQSLKEQAAAKAADDAEKAQEDERRRRERDAKKAAVEAQDEERKNRRGQGLAPTKQLDQEAAPVPTIAPLGRKADQQLDDAQKLSDAVVDIGRDAQAALLDGSTADERAQKEAGALEQVQSGWQTYAENVKRIQDDIAGREKSLADELAGIGGGAKTEEQNWRAKAKAAKEYQAAAEEAMKAGKLGEAQALADQAREAYGSLKGGGGKIGERQGNTAAYAGVKSAGELGLTIAKMLQQTAAKDALRALPADAGLGNLGATVRGSLASIAGGGAGGQGAGANPAGGGAKVHELRFAGGSLSGSQQDVEALLAALEKAGMATA